jgi:hypothetical protein
VRRLEAIDPEHTRAPQRQLVERSAANSAETDYDGVV